ncbi:MAG: DASS family sodium-coupled anion symporter [Planctomycetota bacterium]
MLPEEPGSPDPAAQVPSSPDPTSPATSEADAPPEAREAWWRRKSVQAAGGLLLAGLTWALAFPSSGPLVARMAAVAVLMAAWWVLEVVPLYVTALLPLVLFPLLRIASLDKTAASYGKSTLFLFLGGFLLALGLQRAGLHRRIALRIVAAIGSRPTRLVLGFMLATALLSMWISNTASVMVMLPIALSVLEEAKGGGRPEGEVALLGTAVMLGIAYAADIGGMATPVGTPPNLVLIDQLPELLPGAPAIGFGQWLALGLPLSALFLLSGWWVLTRRVFPLASEPVFGESHVVHEALERLGPVRRDEVLAGLVFLCAALLWVTGADVQLGPGLKLTGWRAWLDLQGFDDGSVAIGAALLLFLLPSERPGERLMDWPTVQRQLPWGLLLLFGGGFALAAGFKSSGLSDAIGRSLTSLSGLSPLALIALVCLVLTFLTELTSNTATTALVLPILASVGPTLGIDPRALMIPATLSASCAFMMPVASPTQAIVFGSGYVTIGQMVRAGLWFNALGVVLVTALFATVGVAVFGIDLGVVPAWAGR